MLPGLSVLHLAPRYEYLLSFQRVLIQLTLLKDAETKQGTSTRTFDMRGRTPFRVHFDPQIADDYRILLTGSGVDKYPGKQPPQSALTRVR